MREIAALILGLEWGMAWGLGLGFLGGGEEILEGK